MNKPFNFYSDCVNIPQSEVVQLIEMIDNSQSISYKTFIKHCNCFDIFKSLGYVINGNGLKISNDYCVNFNKSKFRGKTCYFFKWSAIEFIFI